ncbi:MAG: sigma factor [Acidimicrobiales bacterium]
MSSVTSTGHLRSVPAGTPTLEQVARDHGRFIYTVAYRLAGNQSDAQDLVQEVCW